MEPSTFIVSDGLNDLVMLIRNGVYDDAVSGWCRAVLLLPYDLSDLETTTLLNYIERCKETSK